MSPTRFPASGAKFCASSTSIPVSVSASRAAAGDAARAGIWNHGCTQINTDRKKTDKKGTRTANLTNPFAHFAGWDIANHNSREDNPFLLSLSVFICVHPWLQWHLSH